MSSWSALIVLVLLGTMWQAEPTESHMGFERES